MYNLDPRSLFEDWLRSQREQKARERREKQGERSEPDPSEIVSKRDERGAPYRGDFPNPASDSTRGCF
jgi:hypothetical protein